MKDVIGILGLTAIFAMGGMFGTAALMQQITDSRRAAESPKIAVERPLSEEEVDAQLRREMRARTADMMRIVTASRFGAGGGAAVGFLLSVGYVVYRKRREAAEPSPEKATT